MQWRVEETGRDEVTCATLEDAKQYVEDRAVEIWDALVDPNLRLRPVFPGVEWNWENEDTTPGNARVVRVATMGNTEWRIRGVQSND